MNKKNFFKICLLLATTISLSGCLKRTKRGYLIFYVWGNQDELENYERISSDFEEETGIHVDVQSSADYYNNLQIMFSSDNSAPDVFWTESGQFNSHIKQNKLLNLSPYFSSDLLDVMSDENPEGQIELWEGNDTYRYDGEVFGEGDYYALIKDWSTDFVCWYNKSYIDSYNKLYGYKKGNPNFIEYPSETIPMSWDEFNDLAYKLQEDQSLKATTKLEYGTMLDRVPYKHLFEMIQMKGVSPWDNQGYFNYTSEELKQAFRYFIDLQIGDKPVSPLVTSASAIDSGTSFYNGKVMFCYFGNWAYTSYGWGEMKDKGYEIGLCPPPTPKKATKEEETYAGCASMVGLGIYNRSTMKTEAVKFLNYYMTQGQDYLAGKGFNIPGNKAVAASDSFLKSENKEQEYINNYFFNIASKYSHNIEYNKDIAQEKVEDKINSTLKPYLEAGVKVTDRQIEDIVFSIYDQLRREF